MERTEVDGQLTVNRFDCLLNGLDAPFTVHPNLQLHNLWPYELSDLLTCINMIDKLLDACNSGNKQSSL